MKILERSGSRAGDGGSSIVKIVRHYRNMAKSSEKHRNTRIGPLQFLNFLLKMKKLTKSQEKSARKDVGLNPLIGFFHIKRLFKRMHGRTRMAGRTVVHSSVILISGPADLRGCGMCEVLIETE